MVWFPNGPESVMMRKMHEVLNVIQEIKISQESLLAAVIVSPSIPPPGSLFEANIYAG